MKNIELIICFLLVSASSLLSAAEVALFSLSRFQIRNIRSNFSKTYKNIKTLLSDPGGILFSILVSNELINVSIATIVATVISRTWETHYNLLTKIPFIKTAWVENTPPWALQALLGILITSPVLLFLCEITPKVIGTKMNQIIAPLTSRPLLWIYSFLKPLRILVTWIGQILKGSEQPKLPSNEELLKEEDFIHLLEEGHKKGMIHTTEVEMIRNIFSLDDVQVREITTDIRSVYSLKSSVTIEEAIRHLQAKRYYRVPVYEKNKDSIVGVLYAKDVILARLYTDKLKEPISTIMRKPYFVRSSLQVNTLFRRLKQYQTHLAIVREREKIIGIVTMNDVLDEIFEDVFMARLSVRSNRVEF